MRSPLNVRRVDIRHDDGYEAPDHPLNQIAKVLLLRMYHHDVTIIGDKYAGYHVVEADGEHKRILPRVYESLRSRNYVTRRGPPFAISNHGKEAARTFLKGETDANHER
jgi:hypothetical protein